MLSWIIVALVFVYPDISGAQLYKYKDKDGNVHFTNDLESIPENQRLEAEALPEKEEYAVPKGEPAKEERAAEAKGKPAPAEEAAEAETDSSSKEGAAPPGEELKDPKVLEALNARKEALDQERRRLEQEEDRIIAKIQTLNMERPIRNLNRDLISVNGQLEEQKQKRDAFEKKWKAYHDSPKDASDAAALKQTKENLDMQHFQIQEEMGALLKKGRSVRTSRESRVYKRKMRDLHERIGLYRSGRDAYEKQLEDLYTAPKT